jgi:hypothetical protein
MEGGLTTPVYQTSSIWHVDGPQSTIVVIPTNAWLKKTTHSQWEPGTQSKLQSDITISHIFAAG